MPVNKAGIVCRIAFIISFLLCSFLYICFDATKLFAIGWLISFILSMIILEQADRSTGIFENIIISLFGPVTLLTLLATGVYIKLGGKHGY